MCAANSPSLPERAAEPSCNLKFQLQSRNRNLALNRVGKRLRLGSGLRKIPMPIHVSIVEDNDKLRGTLAKVIGRTAGFSCVSDYGNAEDALADLPKVKPDVV